MPIDYSNYPDNRKTHIRPAILERAGHCCEWCDVPNYAEGYRSRDGSFYEITEAWELVRAEHYGRRIFSIILTVAHLDHDLTNNDAMDSGGPALPVEQANLVALCQKCHLGHDAKEKARKRKENPNQLELGICKR